jgi:hypothetical protein
MVCSSLRLNNNTIQKITLKVNLIFDGVQPHRKDLHPNQHSQQEDVESGSFQAESWYSQKSG